MVHAGKVQRLREGSFGFLIQTSARRIDAEMKKQLVEHNIDIKIFANLMMLAEEDGINQRQLGKKLGYPEYFTSRNIDALVESGFAERQPDPQSRRSFLIFLTTKGREKAAELPAIIQACNDIFLAPLSKTERVAIIALLQKVAEIEPN